jgi:hypothetical protein
METITSGLGFYAKIRASIGIIILVLLFISAIYCVFSTYDKYDLAKNGQTTYKQNINGTFIDCNKNDITNVNCLFYAEYDDNNNKHYMNMIQTPDKSKVVVGQSPIYYEKNNPDKHVNTPTNPFNIASIASCVICILIIVASIYLYLLLKYKDFATISGGLDAANSVASMFGNRRN